MICAPKARRAYGETRGARECSPANRVLAKRSVNAQLMEGCFTDVGRFSATKVIEKLLVLSV